MELGALHFIDSLLCIAFWGAVILLFMGWLYKRRNSHRPSGYSIMDTSHFSHTYSQSPHHVDFLDEWEKNQRKHKEE
ncbi:hypothetical protein HMPREF0083_04121 [Aneurinibacillus aneurinilyticus ATCC 12856]|uniref:Uncharacterized protein n=1 Tax=Aneurinibacillus aneurinilyticus ATCC 12856 TaxID=649747 RepID=U1WZW6_ANEAE|nr:hypothetical protein HMPREF0083_04121 [Aneurinibacillus aneurinilyticus ATCC 12856]